MALLKDASIARIVKVLDKMESEQALQDLDDLPEDVAQLVLPRLRTCAAIEELRAYGENSAGSMVSRKFVAVPVDWTIGMHRDGDRRDPRQRPADREALRRERGRRTAAAGWLSQTLRPTAT